MPIVLLVLALIPVIALLVFIYFKDKKDKEPIGLLLALFFAGMGTAITAIIAEVIGHLILGAVFSESSVMYNLLFAMVIVAPAEELGKYVVLRLIAWKNKHFDYSYDAIVYAVFVSLGFAALENVGYVFDKGLGVAIARMFTAVPGHACYAVLMGFYFSKAKYAQLTGNKKDYSKNFWYSILIPIVLHGIYDAILMVGGGTGIDAVQGLSILIWFAYFIVLFIFSIVIVNKSSKNDYCIVMITGVDNNRVQTVYRPSFADNWTCSCGAINHYNFCSKCGSARPQSTTWTCPQCGSLSAFNFCGRCGCRKPVQPMGVPGAAPAQPMYQQSGATPTQPMYQPSMPVQPRPPMGDME